MTEKTKEQLEAEKAAAKAKEAEKAEKKAQREKEAAEKKAQKEKEKAERAKAREEERAQKAKEREEEKARKKAEREAARMPEQNGIRRPKPTTLCGKAWSIFDEVSKERGAPASIGEAMNHKDAKDLNEGNMRAEYARWRKFHGISGRIPDPTKVSEATAAAE